MSSTWWLSRSAATFRTQVDARWPDRDKASDGTLGDALHTTGDHVPDRGSSPPGVVRALDLDADLGDSLNSMDVLMGQLLAACRNRTEKRVEYVIYRARIASGTHASAFWTWRRYTGDNPHLGHAHISFNRAGDHDARPFNLPMLGDAVTKGEMRELVSMLLNTPLFGDQAKPELKQVTVRQALRRTYLGHDEAREI